MIRLDVFSRRMNENQFEIVESVRNGQLFHVVNQPTSSPLPRERGELLTRDKKFAVEYMVHQETFLDSSHASTSTKECSIQGLSLLW